MGVIRTGPEAKPKSLGAPIRGAVFILRGSDLPNDSERKRSKVPPTELWSLDI